MSGAWPRFWYAHDSPRNLAAARIVLAAAALWVVLSRVDLPSILAFPPELWEHVGAERRLRFLMLFDLGTERALYGLLHLTLLAAILGVGSRTACFMSGLLLYHFAPMETIIRSANPYLRGLTLPTLGLLILSFGPCGDRLALWRPGRPAAAPGAYRWPLRLVQVLFCEMYVFAAWSKLFASGLPWLAPDNIRRYLLLLNQALPSSLSWVGLAVANHPWACGMLAWAGIGFELVFPIILFVPAAGWVLLPMALLFHLGNSLLFRICFQNWPLLLLFVDWDGAAPAGGTTA